MTPLELKLISNQLDQFALSTKNTIRELNLVLSHIEHLQHSLKDSLITENRHPVQVPVTSQQPKDNTKPSDLIRLKEVLQMTGLSRSSIYSMKNRNEFPQSINLGARSIAWVRSDFKLGNGKGPFSMINETSLGH